MRKRVTAYIYLVSTVGYLLGLKCCFDFLWPILTGATPMPAHMLLIPLMICVLCRSLPIPVRDSETLDLSVISVLAVYLAQGAEAAVSVYMIGSLFTFEPLSPEERQNSKRKYKHLFSIGPKKFFFNDSTIILSIIIPAVLLDWIYAWIPGTISMPEVLLPAATFSLLTFVTNALLQLTMFRLNGNISYHDMVHMMLGLTPNVFAAMPMGLLISFGYASETSMWFVFLMMFPLLLARYAWKLYIDSERARSHLIKAFINSIEAKDKYTQGHSERVAAYSVQIAQQMNLSNRQIQLIQQGSVLHDIGKIGISDTILNKPSYLSDEEQSEMRKHPSIGEKVLKEVGLESEVLEMVRSHHERYDGTGYPDGRVGRELSLAARILCVADAYDAMTSDRPYRKGLSQEIACNNLNEGKGTQFDPEIVDAFIASLEKK